jgi:predicted CXXCH cytochrome family protein
VSARDDADDVKAAGTSRPGRPSAVLALGLVLACAAGSVDAGSLAGSPHDLTRSASYLCEVCHVPLMFGQDAAWVPSWSRDRAGIGFPVYGVPPASPGASELPHENQWPGASTRLCLSCHDGLNASPVLYGGTSQSRGLHHAVTRSGIAPADLVRPPVRGTDLINGHPVFVPYPAQPLAASFHSPPTSSGWGGASPRAVKLVAGWVECVSCHNVHDPAFKPFLRRSNAGSALCLTCHKT